MSAVGVGERLKNARHARGVSLDDIEAATRIRRRYLEALEDEAFDRLPAPVYVKGFLGGYAAYLGFSPDDIQAMYGDLEGRINPGEEPVDVRITPVTPHSRVRRTVLVVSLFVLLGGYFAYIAYVQFRQFAAAPAAAPRSGAAVPSFVSGSSAALRPVTVSGSAPGSAPSTPSATAPVGLSTPVSGSGSAPPAPVFTVTGSAPPPTVSASAPAPGGANVSGSAPAPTVPTAPSMVVAGPVVVAVEASDRSWVRAVADGVTVFEGFLSAGDHQVWQANHQLSLRVGNASALVLTVDGQPLGRLGNPGDVVDKVFTAASP